MAQVPQERGDCGVHGLLVLPSPNRRSESTRSWPRCRDGEPQGLGTPFHAIGGAHHFCGLPGRSRRDTAHGTQQLESSDMRSAQRAPSPQQRAAGQYCMTQAHASVCEGSTTQCRCPNRGDPGSTPNAALSILGARTHRSDANAELSSLEVLVVVNCSSVFPERAAQSAAPGRWRVG